MKTIPALLKQEFIDGYRSTIIKIVTNNGRIFGYTDCDTDLTVDSVVYKSAPGLSRSNFTSTSNDTVSNQEIGSGWVDAPEQDLISGLFDNATVEVAFCSWRNPSYGRTVVQRGNIGVIQWTADGFRADIQSHMRQLTRNLNFIVTANCRHQLFSQYKPGAIGACTLNASSYTFTGTVNSITTQRIKFATGLAKPDQYFQNGILTWTSGNNAGLKHEVKRYISDQVELYLPSFTDIAVGDQFSVAAGCDKSVATCKAKFNNIINFGGFPNIQTEIQYR